MVLNYNGARWLPPLFEAIAKQANESLRVYLVDNGSDDESVELTRRDHPGVVILRMPGNLGYSMAYNAAMSHAFADGCDWVIWANNDIQLEQGCIAEMTRVASESAVGGVFGPAFLEWNTDEPNYYMRGAHPQAIEAMQARRRTPVDVDWVEGSLLMVSRTCVEDVGPLDPCYFFYWEEYDFCRRARYRGWKVALVPSAIARHYAGGSTQGHRDDRFQRLKTRNYYICTLTNPYKSWSRNCIDAVHLLLVRLKAGAIRKESPVLTELAVFVNAIADWPTIRRKWRRDQSGGQPPRFQGVETPVNVEVIGGSQAKA